VELSGDRRLPKHFNLYLQARPDAAAAAAAVAGLLRALYCIPMICNLFYKLSHWLRRPCLAQLLPALTGLLLPVLALPAAAYNEHGWLGATVLVPYLFTLGVQIWSETWYNKRGAALPAVPKGGSAGWLTLQRGVLISACLAEVGLGHGGLSHNFWSCVCVC